MSDNIDFLRIHAELAENDGCPDEAKQLREVADEIERLRAEVAQLATPTLYWQALADESLALDRADAEDAVDLGEIEEFRPLHELPPVWAVRTKAGVEWFKSRADAEAAKEEGNA